MATRKDAIPARPQPLMVGDPAPWFRLPALSGSPNYQFDTVAGRHVLMLFFGSAKPEPSAAALAVVARHRALFDDKAACFFGITLDREDEAQGRIAQQIPGIRFLLDYGREARAGLRRGRGRRHTAPRARRSAPL